MYSGLHVESLAQCHRFRIALYQSVVLCFCAGMSHLSFFLMDAMVFCAKFVKVHCIARHKCMGVIAVNILWYVVI